MGSVLEQWEVLYQSHDLPAILKTINKQSVGNDWGKLDTFELKLYCNNQTFMYL
jgi:hypothetical protein